jgi:hypothetical protein
MAKRTKIDCRGAKKDRSHDNYDQAFSYESHLGWLILQVEKLGGLVFES